MYAEDQLTLQLQATTVEVQHTPRLVSGKQAAS
jgi:hypothetical protein